MAVDFSRFNFFKRLDARGRIFILIASVVGIIFLVYIGSRWLSGGARTTGPSRVAPPPHGLESVQGGKLIPEYQKALMQANAQRAQQAQMSATGAITTMVNQGGQTSASGCIVCADQTPNVKNKLDDWLSHAAITPEVAQQLQQLADKNTPVGDYANALDNLVKQGKLTPEQARQLLEEYKKQHAAKLLADSGKAMDDLIKSGQLPIDAANELLAAQKQGVSPSEYAAKLQDLVRQGKISPEVAQQLLAQYAQQRAKEITDQSIAVLHQLAQAGQISAAIETDLVDLESRMVPLDTFSTGLQKYITGGKIIPAVANKILDEYKEQKAAIGPTGSINQMLQKAEEEAYQEISDLLKAGKITREVAEQLSAMIKKNVSLTEYEKYINKLVAERKLSPDIAKIKIGDYKVVTGLREEAKRLAALQANNVSPTTYADELKRAVADGALTPDQAAQLMREYQAMSAKAPQPIVGGAGNEAFAKLQQGVQKGAVSAAGPPITPEEFATVENKGEEASDQERQARIQALMSAMSSQAQQLIASWEPPKMEYRAGAARVVTTTTERRGGRGRAGETTEVKTTTVEERPLIKSGTILFAVLDVQANSDYPDSPILATIVDGPFKGAKLLGKLQLTKSVTGQMDRIGLTFTLMNMEQWAKSKSITAYAIDPDTARTALATSVNHHYLKRYGALLATSFLQGYANAITTSSSTTTTGIFGTSTTHPQLNPSSKLMVGFGQVGQTLGNATQNYVNTPPTVRIEAGVGLGILFMADVT